MRSARVAAIALVSLPLVANGGDLQSSAAACAPKFWRMDADAVASSIFESPVSLSSGLPLEDPKASDSIASLFTDAFAGNANVRLALQARFTGGALSFRSFRSTRIAAMADARSGPVSPRTRLGRPAAPARRTSSSRTSSRRCSRADPIGADCEAEGLDVWNAELSVLIQSRPGAFGGS